LDIGVVPDLHAAVLAFIQAGVLVSRIIGRSQDTPSKCGARWAAAQKHVCLLLR
jgi:hypothetical protein